MKKTTTALKHNANKKLENLTLRQISKRLDLVFNMASKEQFRSGMEWYENAHDFLGDLSEWYLKPTLVVGHCCSALSPRNNWEKNKLDTITILEAEKKGISPEKVSVSTFHKNKFKSYNAARENLIIEPSSQKTYSFVRNMALLDEERVTIDIWALRACYFGTDIKIDDAKISRIAYKQLEELFIRKAKILGMKGFQYQAILWVVMREGFKK